MRHIRVFWKASDAVVHAFQIRISTYERCRGVQVTTHALRGRRRRAQAEPTDARV